MDLKVSIVVDNTAFKVQKAEWGFSCLIEVDGISYLFDTGQSGDCALENAKMLRIDLSKIEKILVSHGHFDHIGGLEKVLNSISGRTILINRDAFRERYLVTKTGKINIGSKYSEHFLEEKYGANFEFIEGLTKVGGAIYMLGQVPQENSFESIPDHFQIIDNTGVLVKDEFKDENSLIIDTEKGLIIVTGCAHRGIFNVINYAKKTFNKSIYGIVGGFHFEDLNDEQFKNALNCLKGENLSLIAPSHCTGIQRIFEMKAMFPDLVIPALGGQTIMPFKVRS